MSLEPDVWIEEGGFAVARDKKRMRGWRQRWGLGRRPFRRTVAYEEESLRVAQAQAAKAAYRLVGVLTERMR
ncbi:MAG: hypothetical protein IPJ98_07165 [Bryobacterales bacterium]|nr:hypothetical protein [Bryobacterales bacterium]